MPIWCAGLLLIITSLMGCISRGGFAPGGDGSLDASPDARSDAGHVCPAPCPDPSFGTQGLLLLGAGGEHNGTWADHPLAEQPDGKLVVSGRAKRDTEQDLLVARLLPDGALDPTFGEGGVAQIDLGTDDEQAKSVSVLPDGRILASGFTTTAPDVTTAAAVLLQGDGTLDRTFGGGDGFFTGRDTADRALVNGHARLGDGRLFFSGQSRLAHAGTHDFFAFRLLADGRLDPSFNTTGYVRIDIGGADEFGHAPQVQADGKIILSGSSWVGGGASFDCAITRLTPDGSLDIGFGDGGHVLHDIGSVHNSCHAFVLPGGKLLAVGTSKLDTGNQMFALRLLADGSPDTSFASAGTLRIELGASAGGRTALPLDGLTHYQGRVLLGGWRSNGSDRDFAIVAIDDAGNVDRSFCQDGSLLIDARKGADDEIQQLLLDREGRLLVQGTSLLDEARKYVVMRLLL